MELSSLIGLIVIIILSTALAIATKRKDAKIEVLAIQLDIAKRDLAIERMTPEKRDNLNVLLRSSDCYRYAGVLQSVKPIGGESTFKPTQREDIKKTIGTADRKQTIIMQLIATSRFSVTDSIKEADKIIASLTKEAK